MQAMQERLPAHVFEGLEWAPVPQKPSSGVVTLIGEGGVGSVAAYRKNES